MIAGYSFDMEATGHMSPHGYGIVREDGSDCGSYKLDFTSVEMRPVAMQSQLGAGPHALCRWSQRKIRLSPVRRFSAHTQ
jgi:phytoene dehydrogenase-like protein